MNSRRFLLALALFPLAILAGACGHTNKLAQYDVTGKTALFRSSAASDAASSISLIESPSKNTVTEVIAAVGSVIVGDQARRKLERAINGDSIAHAISQGIRNSTADYLNMRPVEGIANDPDFIVETELTECRIISSSAGIALRVQGNSRVLDRRSGGIVWEDSESHTIPLSQTYLAAFGPKVVSSGMSIFNAVQLLNLSEEEIRSVVENASMDAGREIGETLREDVADMKGR